MFIKAARTRHSEATLSAVVFSLLAALLFLLTPAFAGTDLSAESDRIEELFQAGALKKAYKALDQFEKKNPDSEFLPRLYLAAAATQDTPLKAVPAYRSVIDRFASSKEAATAQIELAQLLFISGNATAASAEARRFLEKHPDHASGFDAVMLLAVIEAQSGRIGLAANRYAEVAVRYGKHPKVAQAYAGLGDCRFRMEDWSGSQNAYWEALKKQSKNLDQGKVYYQLGLIAQKRNRLGEAHRYFMLLAKNYPGTRYAKLAKSALTSLNMAPTAPLLSSDQTLAPLSLPRTTFTVKVGRFDLKPRAESFAGKFADAGHEVFVDQTPGGYEVTVGRFFGEMDTFFFAEQLQKKFGVKTEILRINGQEK